MESSCNNISINQSFELNSELLLSHYYNNLDKFKMLRVLK
jgi:hypothetical protein